MADQIYTTSTPTNYYNIKIPTEGCCKSDVERFFEGDRCRIKEGYAGAGDVYFYIGKSPYNDGDVVVWETHPGRVMHLLEESIEPYPYTMEEQIEFYIAEVGPMTVSQKAILWGILEYLI